MGRSRTASKKLIEVLGETPLDPMWEKHGGFIDSNPRFVKLVSGNQPKHKPNTCKFGGNTAYHMHYLTNRKQ